MGYDSPNGTCYAKRASGAMIDYDYIVYFENDRPYDGEDNLATVTGLADCVAELKRELNSIKLMDDTRILLLASTDKKASDQHNYDLGERRLGMVYGLFGDNYKDKVLMHNGGEVNDHFTNTGNNANPEERAVRIIVASRDQAQRIIQQSSNSYLSNTEIIVSQPDRTKQSKAEIERLTKEIRDALGSMNISVWKDKNGNFNTARLASDSIAGVVLGTAGGLITSHVNKKNQLTSGFEDIKCTIGGQMVAEYGDEFDVGRK